MSGYSSPDMGTPNKVTPEVLAEIIRRWNGRESQIEIGTALGLNRATVATHLREFAGVQTPDTWTGGGRVNVPKLAAPIVRPPPVRYPNNPPLLSAPLELSPGEAARFMSHVAPPDANGCRRWTASLNTCGYGQISEAGGISRAHRVSWRIHYGFIPEKMQINHRCDVRPCVEPTHLWLGTQAENMADMAAKERAVGTHPTMAGENNVTAKITWEIVREIRRLRQTEGLTLHALARRFGLCKSQVSNIVNMRQWVE